MTPFLSAGMATESPESPVCNVIAPIETFHTTLDDPERFSSFFGALKVVAYIFKFIERLKNKVKGPTFDQCDTNAVALIASTQVGSSAARYH